MNWSRKSNSAIRLFASALSLSLCLCLAPVAFAGEAAGTVTHLSGPLFARKADGTMKALSQKSVVEQGDTLVTEKNTYARIKFTDNSEVTLRPNTQLKVEKYSYDQKKPEEDGAVFGLIKGGLRAVTGAVGKRGKQESYKMKTPSATIGIRGTIYGAAQCEGDCGKLPSGLYVDVADGTIVVTNQGGAVLFNAGQFGYVRDAVTMPTILPSNPGLNFSPPPSVSSSVSPKGGGGGEAKAVDCEVR